MSDPRSTDPYRSRFVSTGLTELGSVVGYRRLHRSRGIFGLIIDIIGEVIMSERSIRTRLLRLVFGALAVRDLRLHHPP